MEAMKAPRFWMVVPTLLVAGAVGLAYAKLPAPSAEQQAMAADKKAKAAAGAKQAAEALAKAQDRVAERYKKEKGMRTATSAPAAKKKN
jgi:Flp pilus assembly protein TadB